MGLATSSSIENYHLKTDKHHRELFSLMPYKTFGSSDPAVKHGKPSPDIFLVAASKFPKQPNPDQVCNIGFPNPKVKFGNLSKRNCLMEKIF